MTNVGPGQQPQPPGPPPGQYPPPVGQPHTGFPTPAGPPPPGAPGAHPPPRPGYPQQVVGNPRPAGPTFQAPNPPGKHRGTFAVVLLSIVTIGIYHLYWSAKVFQELRIHRDRGPGGGIGFFSAGGIGAWLLPSTIHDAYREAGQEPPVTSQTGWWVILPLVGWFVWVAKCNGAINALWNLKRGIDT